MQVFRDRRLQFTTRQSLQRSSKFIQPSEFNGLFSHSCQRDRFIQSVLSSDLIRRMTPTSALNKMIRSRKALVLISKRGISTRSILSQPATLVELAFTKNPSVRQAPACGWRKSIVSSSSSVLANISNSSSLEGISMTKKELQKTETEELKLEVDMEELQELASMRCTPLRLRDMYKYAIDFNNQEQRLLNAQFLHKELPIRVAQRAVDLLTLPHGLSEALPIRQIANVYLLYLEKFQEFPVPTTPEGEDEFTDMLQSMILDRSSIPNAIAQGVDEWLQSDLREDIAADRLQEMEDALYRFFTARVGLRFLCEHHILSSPSRAPGRTAIRKSQSSFTDEEDDDLLGCIQTDCNPSKEVRMVAQAVARQTEEYYGVCPEIQVVDSTQHLNANFTYVPHHLHYMVGELLKNSCRATVRKYLDESKGEKAQIPPIRVVVVKGKEDVTIKIADRGGGIPRSKHSSIWKFAHSTAGEDESDSDFGVDEATGTKIRGFGLALARIYARYLGGEVTLKSMEGYGLDAYLHLPRLGDACENLPLPVKFSPGELNSNPPRRPASRSFSTYAKREYTHSNAEDNAGRISELLKTRALYHTSNVRQ